MPKGTPPNPEKSVLDDLKLAEAEAEEIRKKLDDQRDELKKVKAADKAAAARITEARVRVKNQWVRFVGEAILHAVERELRDSEGKKQGWFDRLDPVLDTDIKPDYRGLYDEWKQDMRKLGATDDDAKSDTDPNAVKPIVGWKPKSLGDNEWGAQLTGEAVAELPQNLTGVPIIVTTSKGKSWETRITEEVSRDDKTIIVRTAEKPKLPDDGPPGDTDDDAKSDTDPNAVSGSMDSLKPIVGWKPKSLGDNEWGARLAGEAVAELPQNLTGVPIIVTASKGKSWETRITEEVSRDDKTVIVRTAGKPKPPDDGPQDTSDTATATPRISVPDA